MHTAETNHAPLPKANVSAARPPASVLSWLAGRRGALAIAGLAFLLTLPALGFGKMIDDWGFERRFNRGDGPLQVFTSTNEENLAHRDRGMLPWWTSSHMSFHFLRPLTALTHEVEFRHWPKALWAMHLVNSSLYALFVLVVVYLYRAVLPTQPRVAALAALMFAIDESHATNAGWVANRSMLLASVLALLSVLCYVKARTRAAVGERALGPRLGATVCFALSLAAAESGLAALAYIAAYALCCETGHLARRIARLLPELVVFAVWAVCYASGHYGVHGMGLYRDLSSPLSVLTGGLLDLPFWAIMLLGPNLLDWFVMQAVGSARALIALTCLPLLAALYWGLPRKKEYGFFALGALFCVLPLFTTQPQDRLEILATFGGFGLIAGFVSAVAEQVHAPRALRVMRGVFIGLHLVLAPILFIPALASFKLLDDAAGKIASAVPAPAPKHVVLLYSPVEMLIQFACMRTDEDPERKRLETWAELFAGSDALQVRRVDERTLELRPERGWGYGPGERLYSPIADMPRSGTRLHVADMDVTVDESSPDGRPLRVSFRFPTPLEDSERLFLVWQGKHPVPWQPPAVGQSQSLPALSLMNL